MNEKNTEKIKRFREEVFEKILKLAGQNVNGREYQKKFADVAVAVGRLGYAKYGVPVKFLSPDSKTSWHGIYYDADNVILYNSLKAPMLDGKEKSDKDGLSDVSKVVVEIVRILETMEHENAHALDYTNNNKHSPLHYLEALQCQLNLLPVRYLRINFPDKKEFIMHYRDAIYENKADEVYAITRSYLKLHEFFRAFKEYVEVRYPLASKDCEKSLPYLSETILLQSAEYHKLADTCLKEADWVINSYNNWIKESKNNFKEGKEKFKSLCHALAKRELAMPSNRDRIIQRDLQIYMMLDFVFDEEIALQFVERNKTQTEKRDIYDLLNKSWFALCELNQERKSNPDFNLRKWFKDNAHKHPLPKGKKDETSKYEIVCEINDEMQKN